MPFIKLQGFSGTAPRIGPAQLQANQAQVANNVKLFSGELRSWKKNKFYYEPLVDDVTSIYKLFNTLGEYKWLTWSTDVDVVESPVADNSESRIYYTGDGAPKKTNYTLAATGLGPYPADSLNMGVPAPTGAPTLSAAGGSSPTETRAYAYTYVSTFGSVKEESAPSPAATVVCNTSGATVTVSGFAAAPTTGYNITHKRIYRSVTGASTVNYQLVAEIPVGTTSYADTVAVAALGQTLPSLYWTPPPDGLKGLVALPNGILAGFQNNEIWFCEPYYPHAWPDSYVLTTEYPIVGLGVYDTTLVVGTTRNPYLITGSHPSAMTQSKLPMVQPCISKRSFASDQFGVVYASPNGLVAVGPGIQDVFTQALYTRDEWQTLNPQTMLGTIYNNMYVGFHRNDVGEISSIVVTRNDQPPLADLALDATAVFIERSTGELYICSKFDNFIYEVDADAVNNLVYEWKSKKFVLPNPLSFGVFKVQADFEYMNDVNAYNAYVDELIAYNQSLFAALPYLGPVNTAPVNNWTLNGSAMAEIPVRGETRTISVLVYGDGELVFSSGITNEEPIRMPVTGKSYVWEVKITGNTPVRTFAMATSIGELREVPQS